MSRPIKSRNSSEALARENEELRARLEEAQEVIEAIRTGRVDALAMEGPDGEGIYTLEGADHPYRTFVETMNEGAMTVSTDGTILYCNQVLADLIGLSLEHTLGSDLRRFVWPSDLRSWESWIHGAQGSRRRVELSLRHADGIMIPVQMSARSMTPMQTVCVIVTDLREQKVQEKLRASEERLRSIYDHAATGIAIMDMEGRFQQCNASYCALVGYTEEEFHQLKFSMLVHPEDRDANLAQIRRLVDQELPFFEIENRYVRKNGDPVWVHKFVSLLRAEDGSPKQLMTLVTNITERKQAEAALHEREEQLRSFAGKLERLVDERTQELVQSQHRLRAMAMELNLVEQRERKRLAGELHDYLAQLLVLSCLKLGQIRRAGVSAQVETAVKETEEVLTQALDYSRTLMAELSPPVLQEHGLAAGLKWLGEQMQHQGLMVHVEGGDASEVSLPNDCAMLLFQSVRELLMNALKHASCQMVIIRLHEGENRLCIEVRDDGIGFDLAAAAAAAGSSTTAMSSKFGLFSIRERMIALGGWFDVQSAPGEGTTARLVLPIGSTSLPSSELEVLSSELSEAVDSKFSTQSPALSSNSALRTQHSTTHQQDAKIRVLLVDDHAMVRQGLRTVLDSFADIEVVGEAWNGEEAVAFVEQLQPSVVVMDINMPKMNGIEATAHIKARHSEIIVIGLSVNVGGKNETAMKQAGAARLLTKEAAMDELYQAIQQVQRPSLM